MAEKKLSKKALNKSFRNWFYGHLTCFSQEHMQTFGYLCAMLPLVEELYDTKEEQTEALKTYSCILQHRAAAGHRHRRHDRRSGRSQGQRRGHRR